MAEKTSSFGWAVAIAVGLAIGTLITIGSELRGIRSAINRNTNLSLCIEAAKLKVAEAECDQLLARARQP